MIERDVEALVILKGGLVIAISLVDYQRIFTKRGVKFFSEGQGVHIGSGGGRKTVDSIKRAGEKTEIHLNTFINGKEVMAVVHKKDLPMFALGQKMLEDAKVYVEKAIEGAELVDEMAAAQAHSAATLKALKNKKK